MDEERVSFLASHDWNSISIEPVDSESASTEHLSEDEIRGLVATAFDLGLTAAAEEELAVPNTAGKPPVEHHLGDDQDAGGASIAGKCTAFVSTSLLPDGDPGPDDSGPSVDQPQVSPPQTGSAHATAEHLSPEPPAPPVPLAGPPSGGGELVTPTITRQRKKESRARAKVSARQMDVGDRIAAYLGQHGLTAQAAADKGVDFGVHVATIYNILKGQRVIDQTLDKVTAALDALETLYMESVVLRLPNNLTPIIGLNPIPDLKPPQRCSRVP